MTLIFQSFKDEPSGWKYWKTACVSWQPLKTAVVLCYCQTCAVIKGKGSNSQAAWMSLNLIPGRSIRPRPGPSDPHVHVRIIFLLDLSVCESVSEVTLVLCTAAVRQLFTHPHLSCAELGYG